MRDINKEMIVFAIDNGHKLHERMKFLKHIDIARAMGTLKGVFHTCIGYWNGELENSYMMSASDYERLVKPLGFTDKQICILRVSGDVRQPCFIEFPDGDVENVGAMHEISADEAKRANAWTYVEGTGKYFATKGK